MSDSSSTGSGQGSGGQGTGRGQVSEGGFQSDTGTGPHIATTPSGGANQAGAASDGSNEMTYHGGDTGAGAGGLLPGRQEEAKEELAAEALDGDAVPSGTGRDTAQIAEPAGTGTPPLTNVPADRPGPEAAKVNAPHDRDDPADPDDTDEEDEGDEPVAPV